jgi:hypothetical protein
VLRSNLRVPLLLWLAATQIDDTIWGRRRLFFETDFVVHLKDTKRLPPPHPHTKKKRETKIEEKKCSLGD